jgi:hypothetical protein
MKYKFTVELEESDDLNRLQTYIKAEELKIVIDDFFAETRKIVKYGSEEEETEKLIPGLERAREIMGELLHDFKSK